MSLKTVEVFSFVVPNLIYWSCARPEMERGQTLPFVLQNPKRFKAAAYPTFGII